MQAVDMRAEEAQEAQEWSESELLPAPALASAPPTSGRHRLVAALAGLTFFAVLAVAEMWGGSAQANGISPRKLFEEPEIVNLIATQRLEVGRRFNRPAGFKEFTATRDAVARKLRQTGKELSQRVPGIADNAVVSEEEKEGVMHLLRHLGDRRVQGIGRAFARAEKESSSLDRDAQKRYIVEKLRPRAREIQGLHREIFVGLPARLAGADKGDWARLLPARTEQPRRLQVIAANGMVVPAVSTAAPDLGLIEEAQALLQEAESMIEALKLMFHDQIKAMGIPLLTDLLDASDDLLGVAECSLEAGKTAETTGEIPTEKLMTCPLKVGDKGMQAIATLAKDLGLDPTEVGLDEDADGVKG